jgi:hypothetical protein
MNPIEEDWNAERDRAVIRTVDTRREYFDMMTPRR